MIDLNSKSMITERLVGLIDEALVAENCQQTPRDYLGGSRLGEACGRKLQFEFFKTPKDEGRELTGQALRIFEAGHLYEEMAIRWLRLAGFDLRTCKADGSQFGFSAAGGKIKGHVDGVMVGGPDCLEYPCLWECKSMKEKHFRECFKHGVSKSKPVYYGQMQIYMAYMDLTEHPALFTAVNKDTQEIYFELVPFNPQRAQTLSDIGVTILKHCETGELMPRIANDESNFNCKWCDWHNRCWSLER